MELIQSEFPNVPPTIRCTFKIFVYLCVFVLSFAIISRIILCFHSAHPTRWAESISGIGLCCYVAMSVITLKIIIISAHRLHRPLWPYTLWKLFKNHKRTQIQRQRQLIPNMMKDTSPWSFCSRWSPWLPSSSHTISSTGPSVSPFRDFYINPIISTDSFCKQF